MRTSGKLYRCAVFYELSRRDRDIVDLIVVIRFGVIARNVDKDRNELAVHIVRISDLTGIGTLKVKLFEFGLDLLVNSVGILIRYRNSRFSW